MHVIICGGRSTRLTPADIRWLDALRQQHGITHVSHGAAPGVDTDADSWAEACGLRIRVFPAAWDTEGRRAGPLRNARMLVALLEAQAQGEQIAVISFKGGKGTANMCAQAQAAGVPVWRREAQSCPTT